MISRLFPLVLLLHIEGSVTLDPYVSCSKNSICAVKESEVTLKCFHSNNNIKTVFWFSQKQNTNWRNNNEPEDLTLDSDYSGRVKDQISNDQSTLTISDLRETDSGEYQLMIIMKDGVKRLSSVSVNLTVTDLKVKVDPTDEKEVKLTCDSSCNSGVWYWWKDVQYLGRIYSRDMIVSVKEKSGSYSCSVDRNLKHRSPNVCVSQDQCWDVIYSSRRVCALVGSTVDFSCTYSHPSGLTLNKTFWHYVQSGDFKDLREDHQFAGRVENEENKLRIKELKINDSGEYRFRIITDTTEGKYSGSPGVILTVTDTQVTRIISEGEKVILMCSTKCSLSDKHTYIWLKNGRQVTDGFTKLNKLYLDSIGEDLQEYSCTVGGPEESRALRNTTIILSVILVLVIIGVLLYRWRSRTYPKTPRVEREREEVQYDTVYNNAAPSDLNQKTDPDNQDIHYSTISFKTKHTSLVPTDCECPAETSETDNVHYAAVKFK